MIHGCFWTYIVVTAFPQIEFEIRISNAEIIGRSAASRRFGRRVRSAKRKLLVVCDIDGTVRPKPRRRGDVGTSGEDHVNGTIPIYMSLIDKP